MFGLTSYDGKLDIAYFYTDTISELANLPNLTANGKGNLYTINAVGVGSKCDCYEDKNIYILKGDNTWQIYKPIEDSGSYTLPTASTTTLGGVKIDGTSVTIDANGVISATQPLELEQTNISLSTSTTTTVTFTNANITANSFIEYGCSQWNLVPDDIVTSTGSCVITLPKVDTATTVTVRIYVR